MNLDFSLVNERRFIMYSNYENLNQGFDQHEMYRYQYEYPYNHIQFPGYAPQYVSSEDERLFGPWSPFHGGQYGPPPGPPFGPPPGRPPGPPFGSPPGPPGQPPGQMGGPPTAPPPAFMPPEQEVGVFAVDPGGIRGCLYRNTFIRLTNGQRFWYYPTFVGRTSVAGYRWTGFRWVYFGIDLRRISSFQCV